jgi:transcriptional regulator with PAS, ATPase and Fis domain
MLSDRDILSAMPTSVKPASIQENGVSQPSEAAAIAHGTRLSTAERAQIDRVLAQVGGNKTKAAQLLGISRRSRYRWVDRLDIDPLALPRRDSPA